MKRDHHSRCANSCHTRVPASIAVLQRRRCQGLTASRQARSTSTSRVIPQKRKVTFKEWRLRALIGLIKLHVHCGIHGATERKVDNLAIPGFLAQFGKAMRKDRDGLGRSQVFAAAPASTLRPLPLTRRTPISPMWLLFRAATPRTP